MDEDEGVDDDTKKKKTGNDDNEDEGVDDNKDKKKEDDNDADKKGRPTDDDPKKPKPNNDADKSSRRKPPPPPPNNDTPPQQQKKRFLRRGGPTPGSRADRASKRGRGNAGSQRGSWQIGTFQEEKCTDCVWDWGEQFGVDVVYAGMEAALDYGFEMEGFEEFAKDASMENLKGLKLDAKFFGKSPSCETHPYPDN